MTIVLTAQTKPAQLGAAAMRSIELGRQVLTHPNVTSRIVGCIAIRWPELRPDVAAHPRTRRRLLVKLSALHPEAFFANPAARVHVTDPRGWPIRVVETLLAHAPPDWLADMLSTHPLTSMRALAASRVVDPVRAIELACDPDPHVRTAAARNPRLSPDAVELLACDPDYWVRRDVGERDDVSDALQARLAADPESFVRGGVAKRVRDPAVLARLAIDPDPWVRRGCASNAHLTDESACRLAGDPDPDVRLAIATNPRASSAALERVLAADRGDWRDVHRPAIAHPNLSRAAMLRIARSSNVQLRTLLAQRPDLPAEVIDRLVGDPHREVRWQLAYHHADAVRSRLANDPDRGIRVTLVEHLPVVAQVDAFAADPDAWIREYVARRSATAAVLDQLASDPDARVRVRVAFNPAAPPIALARLANDADDDTARGALIHAAIGLDALLAALRERHGTLAATMIQQRLRDHRASFDAVASAPDTARLLAELPGLPPAIADRIESTTTSPAVREALARATPDLTRVERLVRHDSGVRRAAAERDLSIELAEQLALDPDPAVRSALAQHTRHRRIHEWLLADDDEHVRWAALRNRVAPISVLLRALGRSDDRARWARDTLVELRHPRGGRPGL